MASLHWIRHQSEYSAVTDRCSVWKSVVPIMAITLIARFMGPTWAHLGSTGPRWAPCWPHEFCYLGRQSVWCPFLRLLHSSSLVTVRLSVGYENGWLAGITILWSFGLNIDWDCLSHNALWAQMTSGNFRFSEATNSPFAQPWQQENVWH